MPRSIKKSAPAPARASRAKRQPAAAASPNGPRPGSGLAVAVDLLRAAGEPTKVTDLTRAVVKSGRAKALTGKTPEATISAHLYVAARAGRLVKVAAPGTVDLLEPRPAPRRPHDGVASRVRNGTARAPGDGAPARGARRRRSGRTPAGGTSARDGSQVPICTGTLLAPQVVETAAHCFPYAASLGATPDGYAVSFDNPLTWNAAGKVNDAIPVASIVSNPLFQVQKSDYHDQAVLQLAQPAVGITPAHLAPVGTLDPLNSQSTLTAVTRGATVYGDTCPATPSECAGRNDVTVDFQSTTQAFLRFSGDPVGHNLVIWLGDSGSPLFLNGSNPSAVVATVETLSASPRENSSNMEAMRLDTAEAHAFIDPFLP